MKKIWLLLSIVFIAGNYLFANNPTLVFVGKRIVDIGTVTEGDTINNYFIIKNEGKSPLIIKGVGKSCNCTDVTITKKTLPPNDTTQFNVIVSTEGKIGPTSVNVILEANTPQQEHVAVLKMNVIRRKLKDEK